MFQLSSLCNSSSANKDNTSTRVETVEVDGITIFDQEKLKELPRTCSLRMETCNTLFVSLLKNVTDKFFDPYIIVSICRVESLCIQLNNAILKKIII